ncbi:Nimrod C1, partial [Carabus blaptoides fortunei]
NTCMFLVLYMYLYYRLLYILVSSCTCLWHPIHIQNYTCMFLVLYMYLYYRLSYTLASSCI